MKEVDSLRDYSLSKDQESNLKELLKVYTVDQLYIILQALRDNIDISILSNYTFEADLMKVILKALKDNIDISPYIDDDISPEKANIIVKCIKNKQEFLIDKIGKGLSTKKINKILDIISS